MANKTTTTTTTTLKSILSSPRQYIDHYMTITKDIKVNHQGDLYHVKNSGLNTENIRNSIWLDYKEDVASFNSGKPKEDRVTRFPQQELGYAIDEYVSCYIFTILESMRNSIKCVQEDNTEMKKFVKAITGKVDDLDLAVITHFIWQIKRKLNGYDTVYEMMTVIYGKQGSGKSVAVELLTRPLMDVRMNLSLDVFADKARLTSFRNNFVCVADELEGAHRTDIDALKRMITAKEFEYPILYSNSMGRVRQNCTFIGTTNRNINEQIIDHTGMRRFYEMKSLDKINWRDINNIDYFALWSGVDENKSEGYIVGDVFESLQNVQKSYASSDPFNEFLKDYCIELPENDENTTLVKLDSLYKLYKDYCIEGTIKPINKLTFAKKLNNHGFNKIKKRPNGSKNPSAHYEINKNKDCYFSNDTDLDMVRRKLRVVEND